MSRYKNQDFLHQLGEHCRRLRTQRGYSIDRMSKESEQLSTSVIQRLETGSGPVSVASLFRYAEVLELPPKALLDFEFSFARDPAGPEPVVLGRDDAAARRGAFKTHLPFYSLKAAAGYFGRGESVQSLGWVDARSVGQLDARMFVVRAAGDSMLPRIRSGDYLVMRADPAGTRQDKIVLAEYKGVADPDTGGSYTVKKYVSAKMMDADGGWRHREIRLVPLNPAFEPIVLRPESEADFRIVAEFVGVLEMS